MQRGFKYRLYPTPAQESTLFRTLEECRWLYNHFLEERKNSWEQEQKSVGKWEQQHSVLVLRVERPALALVHSHVLQNVAMRVDLAFKAFFRRCKAGEKPGYPRFKGKGWYKSFTYPDSGFSVPAGGFVRLSKIGLVGIKYHRPIEGVVKTCTVSRTQTGKWFVSFSCVVEPTPLPFNELEVGVDMGLATFATFSDGIKIANPRFFKREQKALAKVQRARKKHATALVHERIENKRRNFAHQTSKRVITSYGTICAEKLAVNKMLTGASRKNRDSKDRGAKSVNIADAAWGSFLACIAYKAENAGRVFKQVNPAYTSQDCSACGARTPMPLSERTYQCEECGLVVDRDLNAAKNILRVGLYSLGGAQALALEAAGL